jgi:23S rRNA pseudouridine2605 synthase
MPKDPTQRLQKALAHAGVASRRKSEDLILQGRVSVNGQVVTELGTKVDPDRDEIRVDGQRIKASATHTYLMVHKPRGVLSVMNDDRGRKALSDLVTVPNRVYPVGRLDVSSEGLILLTDDGDLANLLTHPRYKHEKEYLVRVNGDPTPNTLDAWRRGVNLDGKVTARARVDVLQRDKAATLLRLTMREGRKRQIRRVASLLGHPVLELRRVRLGPLYLGTLPPGQWRHLNSNEVQRLKSLKQRARRQKRRPKRKRR